MYKKFHLSGQADRLLITGDEEQAVELRANGFFEFLLTLPPPRSVDFLRIAAGVYALDRICKRKKRPGNDAGARQLQLIIAVQEPDFWQQRSVNKLLTEILSFLTGDDWLLQFEAAQEDGLCYQGRLELPVFSAQQVGLFSGGLDSAAGLANRLLQGGDNFLLVTIGHRPGLHKPVANQLRRLASLLEQACGKRPNYLHSTLTVSLQGGKAERISKQEKSQRVRSFLFCTAAVVAAETYKIDAVEMFENGVGAINLPLMSGMLDNGLATRGAHPEFLRKMSSLTKLVCETDIRLHLPFTNQTKGEMLKALKCSQHLVSWAQTTASCIHTSLRVKGKTHCGCCPACIERRQAFRAAGIGEDTSHYITDIFTGPIKDKEKSGYYKLYRLDAIDWIHGKNGPGKRMNNHLRLSGIPKEHRQQITKLHIKHAHEVFNVFGPPFVTP